MWVCSQFACHSKYIACTSYAICGIDDLYDSKIICWRVSRRRDVWRFWFQWETIFCYLTQTRCILNDLFINIRAWSCFNTVLRPGYSLNVDNINAALLQSALSHNTFLCSFIYVGYLYLSISTILLTPNQYRARSWREDESSWDENGLVRLVDNHRCCY